MKRPAPAWLLVCASLVAACSVLDTPRRAARDGPPGREMDPDRIADAVPRAEPRSRYGNPAHYEVMGKRYYVLPSAEGYREEGIASWYGTKFHGRPTSSGEPYDLYAMTAAHRSLPLPSYVKVENLNNGRSAVVRVNDRGPFHPNRIIDLSYAAAVKLGIDKTGTGLVRVTVAGPGQRSGAAPPGAAAPGRGQAAGSGRQSGGAPVTSRGAPHQARDVRRATPDPHRDTPRGAPRQVRTRDSAARQFFIQFGAFTRRANAQILQDRLAGLRSRLMRIHTARVRGKTFYQVRLGPLRSVAEADRLIARALRLGVDRPRIIALPAPP